jgi:UPF0176 protein
MESELLVSGFYLFHPLDQDGLTDLRKKLLEAGEKLELRGQIIMAGEGLNGTISGMPPRVETFKSQIDSIVGRVGGEPIIFKDSRTERHPFGQWTVKIRPEIVTSTLGPILSPPAKISATGGEDICDYLSPAEWRDRLINDSTAIVLDTRNVYETRIGMFDKAVDPEIDTFIEFTEYLNRSGLPRDRPMLIYCTGGIRCEKAAPLMQQAGFKEIYQLHGGILKFLEEFPDDAFRGECFVFDDRVALDQNLNPSRSYGFCPHCGSPASEPIKCSRCGTTTRICRDCLDSSDQPTMRSACSKNCLVILSRSQS